MASLRLIEIVLVLLYGFGKINEAFVEVRELK